MQTTNTNMRCKHCTKYLRFAWMTAKQPVGELSEVCVWRRIGKAARHSTPMSGGTGVVSTSTNRS